MSEPSADLASLVRSAVAGSEAAWNSLVKQFSPQVWSVIRRYRLTEEQAADVFQQTWLRLVEHLGEIREPASLAAWLTTTARAEALRILRRRSIPTDPVDLPDSFDPGPSPDDALLASDRNEALRRAIGQLPTPCRRLLALLYREPAPSYAEIAAAVGAPIGSIGPTRARCLQRLRELLGPYLEVDDAELVPAIRGGIEVSAPVPDEALGRAQRTFGERHRGDAPADP